MNNFIIVFFAMIITLLFTKYLTTESYKETEEDIVLNFDDHKIKCKCDMSNKSEDIKEKFTNYTKEQNLNLETVPQNDNLVTSLGDLNEPKHNNFTAETYFEKYFKYPLEPMKINNFNINPINQFKYINIGKDTDKVINNINAI